MNRHGGWGGGSSVDYEPVRTSIWSEPVSTLSLLTPKEEAGCRVLTSGTREGTSPDDLSPRGPKKLQVQTSPTFKIQGTGQREAHPWREATFPRPGLATHSICHTNWCKGGGMTQTRPMTQSLELPRQAPILLGSPCWENGARSCLKRVGLRDRRVERDCS